jgi:hypothetical protein
MFSGAWRSNSANTPAIRITMRPVGIVAPIASVGLRKPVWPFTHSIVVRTSGGETDGLAAVTADLLNFDLRDGIPTTMLIKSEKR